MSASVAHDSFKTLMANPQGENKRKPQARLYEEAVHIYIHLAPKLLPLTLPATPYIFSRMFYAMSACHKDTLGQTNF